MAPVRVFDAGLNLLAEVDVYDSLAHARNANKPGQFQLQINWNIFDETGLVQYADFFRIGGFVMIGGDPRKCAIITDIDKPIDPGGKGSQSITVTGYEPTILFQRRVIEVPAGQDTYVLNGDAESVIKAAISDQAGPTATDPARAFSLLEIAPNKHRGPEYLLSAALGDNLLDWLTKCSIATQTAFYIRLDLANKKLVLDCDTGVNRTAGQNPNAIFSPDYDTLESADFTETINQYVNLVTVAGSGKGQTRPVLNVFEGPDEPSDMDRFESFLNASDVTDTPSLTAKAQAVLSSQKFQFTLDATILAQSPLVYGTDWDLADFVTVAAYDFQEDVQVTEVKEEWAKSKYVITPTFNLPPPELPSQMAQAIAGVSQVVSAIGSGSIQRITGATTLPKATTDDTWVVDSPNPTTQDIFTNGASAPGIKRSVLNAGAGLVTLRWDSTESPIPIQPTRSVTVMWSGSRWILTDFPLPAFSARNGASAVPPGNVIAWNGIDVDNYGKFSGGVYTIPLSGTYYFSAHGLLANAPAGEFRWELRNRSGANVQAIEYKSSANVWQSIHVSLLCFCNSGDLIDVVYVMGQGNTYTDPGYNGFYGHMVSRQ